MICLTGAGYFLGVASRHLKDGIPMEIFYGRPACFLWLAWARLPATFWPRRATLKEVHACGPLL